MNTNTVNFPYQFNLALNTRQPRLTDIMNDLNWLEPLRNDSLTPYFKAFTCLGEDIFIYFAPIFAYLGWRKKVFRDIFIMLALGTMINSTIKEFSQIPRPPIEHLVPTKNPLGFPSGHTQNVAMAWTILALYFRRPWLYIWTPIAIILTATSRMYLGVHSPLDVSIGATLGITLAWSYIKIKDSAVIERLTSRNKGTPLIVTTALLIPYFLYTKHKPDHTGVMLTGILLGLIIGSYRDPKVWNIPAPHSLLNKIKYTAVASFSFLLLDELQKTVFQNQSYPLTFFIYTALGLYAFYGLPKFLSIIQARNLNTSSKKRA